MTKETIWSGDIIKDFNEKLQREREEVKRLRKQLAKANKYVHTICQHSDSMLMDYEDYMEGDEEE
tara:strand:+ start:7330 stop:7524 length:195 start_codon:yes stop_codon:yes gene_type:complete